MNTRKVARIIKGMPTSDGAGVKLLRIIGQPAADHVDPFLLLDEFKSENKNDYIAGFPDHPHRGFETVTYMKEGRFIHRDSKGNEGLLTSGCVQWMTAGRGIIHSEMPERFDGKLWGYQLWINLPAKMKMVEPRYQHIEPSEIPVYEKDGVRIKIIAGSVEDLVGPVKIRFPANYFDVNLDAGSTISFQVPASMNAFCYVYEGTLNIHSGKEMEHCKANEMALFAKGDSVSFSADEACGLLFISGDRLEEPVARYGPFVMNTREEIMQAFEDYQSGSLGY